MTKSKDGHTITKQKAIEQLWNHGILHWKLHEHQKKMYDDIIQNQNQVFVVNCSRRLGKSFLLCLIAIEYALKHPNSIVCYVSTTAKSVKTMILPNIRTILQDCPTYLKPKYRSQDSEFEFTNGSLIRIAGTDNGRADALRGGDMNLGICDEAGFMNGLQGLIQNVLMPMTMHTDGRIILSSTPPESVSHDFKKYSDIAKEENAYIHKTIWDNVVLTPQKIKKYMKQTDLDGSYTDEEYDKFLEEKTGPQNTTWLREYMAEFVTDENKAVLPGFNEILAKSITKAIITPTSSSRTENEIVKPKFFDSYVWMDIGYDDNTGVLFGYWDFERATLVIEDELLLQNPLHQTIADAIKAKEFELWANRPPLKRVGDADPMDLAQISALGLQRPSFSPPPRAHKEVGVNMLRTMISNCQINIHPRCRGLLEQMKSATWNNQRNSFTRSDAGMGHYDLLDCLVYAVRTVVRGRNPIPPGYGTNIASQFIRPEVFEKKTTKAFEKLIPFNMRPKRDK